MTFPVQTGPRALEGEGTSPQAPSPWWSPGQYPACSPTDVQPQATLRALARHTRLRMTTSSQVDTVLDFIHSHTVTTYIYIYLYLYTFKLHNHVQNGCIAETTEFHRCWTNGVRKPRVAGGGAAPAPRRARPQKGRLTGDKTRYTPSPAERPAQHPGGGQGLREAVGVE